MVKNFKTLVIVESPGKIKSISKYLGPNFIVKASVGHVVNLSTSGKGNLGVDIENGFKPKYEVIPDKKDKIKAIISASKECNQIYLATDDDREGEAIAWHLSEILEKTELPIYRMKFSEITKAALQKSIKNLGELDPYLYDAQQARRVLDRIVGFSVSPFLINRIGPDLSAGRVQSVAVRLIVDREREIEAFKPEEYWIITSQLAKPNNKKEHFVAKYVDKITDGDIAKKIKADLETDNYTVLDLKETEKKKFPKPPFKTSTLQTSSAGKYKFAPSRTMKAAQTLYESGLITYMRTDSLRIADDAIQMVREFIENKGYDLPKLPILYNKKNKNDVQDAHEAIRPTNVNVTPQNVMLSDDEQKIYSLIWERFVACQMNPAIYDTVSVSIQTSSKHNLRANGRILRYNGWLDIMSDLDDNDNDVRLPPLNIKDNLILVSPRVKAEQKFTKPPSRFTNKTLVETLEDKGIGRPSTYAAIVSKITHKGYVVKKSNAFIPTDKGKSVVDNLVKHFTFMNYNYTADMEVKLDKIAGGKLKYLDMMKEFYEPFKQELRNAYADTEKDYGYRCEKCGAKMVLRHSAKYGFFLGCIQFPNCRSTLNCDVVDGQPVVKQNQKKKELVPGVKCPECGAGMYESAGMWGPFYSCSEYYYTKCKGKRKVPYGKKCPECNNELYATIYHDEDMLFCMGYPNCRYKEKLPKGSLANPKNLLAKKIPKKVKKMLK